LLLLLRRSGRTSAVPRPPPNSRMGTCGDTRAQLTAVAAAAAAGKHVEYIHESLWRMKSTRLHHLDCLQRSLPVHGL